MNKIDKNPEDLREHIDTPEGVCDEKKSFKTTARLKIAIICVLTVVLMSTIICIGYHRSDVLAASRALKGCLVCIDPGHGFDDPGTVSELLGDVTEAQINMSIAQKLASELEKCGFSVVFTHDGITIPFGADIDENGIFDPTERVTYSDRLDTKPELFISIHCDSFPSDATVNGTRLYYQSENAFGVLSGLLRSVAREIDAIDGTRRETLVKPMSRGDAYTVICDRNEYPAFLIECGFVTNEYDAEKLVDAAWQQAFARAVAHGIYKHCNK